jgi:hypothetical protein
MICKVQSRLNSARPHVAMLALSVLVASLPWAKALALCQAPVDTFLNPFTKESAHHRPIGSDAVFADEKHPSTVDLLKVGFGNINSDNGWGFNVYQSKTSDPVKTVVHAGRHNVGLPVTLHVPVGTNNHDTSDAGVVIVEPDGITAHEFYQWRWNNGEPTAAIHRQWDTRGSGHSRPADARVGVSASGVAGMFGLLRGHEVNNPGYRIEHALQISLSHIFKGCKAHQFQAKAVWPAASTDGYCKTNPDLCGGNIPYGALLALPPSVDIAGLGLSEPGGRLAEALQDYGAYAVDGTECANMRGDQDIDAGVKQTLRTDMRKIYPLLRMVLNNSAGETVSGGGTPRAENCAFNSPDR